jgi:predicted DNA-binding transcriptional regulator YafY
LFYFVKKDQMPKNKLASFRYRVINNCLKNTARNWTRIDLNDEIDKQLYESFGIDKGISKRTFHYDIELMRSLPPRGFDAPIVVKDGHYKYEDPDYSIDSIPLSEMDIESINNAVELLSHFKQLPIHSQLSLVKDKVTGQIFTNTESQPIIELEYKAVKGIEFMTPLYQHIKDNLVIEIGYQSFKSKEPKKFVLHPYFLKQYNHRWYLVALSERFGNVGTYSLDRIITVNPMPALRYDNCLNKSHSEHFKDIIGVTLETGKEPVEIIASITPSQAPYIITKPIHDSQKVLEENENEITISIRILPNYEFYSTILSFGSSIKIVSPEFVREEVYNKLKIAYRNYEV